MRLCRNKVIPTRRQVICMPLKNKIIQPMSLKTNIYLVALLFASLLPIKLTADIDFLQKDLSEVRQMAALEGKMYFAFFSADWCMICEWIEENTFKDPLFEDFVAENLLPVKIDFDDERNQRYIDQFKVKVLPSILLFNAQGVLIEKVQYSLDTEELLAIFRKHNLPRNRISPDIAEPLPILDSPERNLVLYRPALQTEANTNTVIAATSDSDYQSTNLEVPFQQATSTASASYPKIKTMPVETEITSSYMNNGNTYQYSPDMPPSNPPPIYQAVPSSDFMAPRSSRKYYIELSVHSNYEKAEADKRILEQKLGEKIHLKSTLERKQALYKVITREFSDFSSAQKYYVALKEKGVFGLIQLVE